MDKKENENNKYKTQFISMSDSLKNNPMKDEILKNATYLKLIDNTKNDLKYQEGEILKYSTEYDGEKYFIYVLVDNDDNDPSKLTVEIYIRKNNYGDLKHCIGIPIENKIDDIEMLIRSNLIEWIELYEDFIDE